MGRIFAAISLLATVILFSNAQPAVSQSAKQPAVADGRTIRIQSYPGNVAAYLTWWVAADKGFCKAHGLTCTFVPLASGPLGMQSLLSGSIDVAAAVTEVVVSATAKGADVQIVASTHPNLYFSLSVSKDVPLSNKGYPEVMKDLKGKRIGVTVRGSAVEMQMRALLIGAGMSPDDVSYVAVGSPGTAYASLLAKQVDAAMMFPPFKAICEVQKTCVTAVDLAKGEGPADLKALNGGVQYVAMTRKFIEANPVVVDALIQSLEDAAKWIKDPANAAEVLQVLKSNYQISKDIANGDAVMAEIARSEAAGAGVTIDRNAVKAYVDYMLKYKLLDKPVDTTDLVYKNAPRP